MKHETEHFIKKYRDRTNAAYEAFRNNNLNQLAQNLFEKGEAAANLYEQDCTDLWDMRMYGAFNAAGGVLEEVGDLEKAEIAYTCALKSCIRVGGLEWKPISEQLQSSIQRVKVKRLLDF